ncbi:MAG: acetylglutamate kinase [Bacteroidales bacterium]|jgi:acetylglutamate kinase|nr:acetylglutamate kinase [Bacteroidales bacterium]MDD2831070.1 acetylglutamate kinase [Bacteroidales bacterium]MDD5046287.1 acetylglutamate kinase [Bacteroidales bacterium]MDD5516100.1 acetylglutamate kinase [Bacteroidales bacterium]MDY0352820.1 acetylglutamate kinase [Bacteroidales bacterium]
MHLNIFKIGGNVIDNPQKLETFLDTFCRCQEKKILVHGGGKLASELSEQLGLKVRMEQGRRITDSMTLRVAVMVYAGWVNKNLVSSLMTRECRALGLSGADGRCIITRKRDPEPVDFGYVGDITDSSVDAVFIQKLLNDGLVPVFSSVTCDNSGQLLNTNADTVASALALAFRSIYTVRLRFIFDKEGVCCPGSDRPLPLLSRTQYEKLRCQDIVSGGMIPKIENALRALERGIEEVYIGNTYIQL